MYDRIDALIEAARFLPAAIRALGEKAVNGDLGAIRLLFELLGLISPTPCGGVQHEEEVADVDS